MFQIDSTPKRGLTEKLSALAVTEKLKEAANPVTQDIQSLKALAQSVQAETRSNACNQLAADTEAKYMSLDTELLVRLVSAPPYLLS